ncbi:DNA-directed RNA polymerase sigma-70 factor [Adhaeribacter aerolatus]|uniref:DNA-directed RNA polymerase sigma-70 factor n=1 Tax=Adhaeribacter aerolatus TaxID=670289 RepID=A0A512B2D6_9BACT|nr:sigma-70 family RNA polymerase sigma factor [Adhaeribacter aerolatus]GEO06126.1 DNA-directed RNA polymerase sigma-70 factor [Adhaeribacter aerolatus]
MQPDEPVDERITWLNFQAGDEKAYAYLFQAYFNKLYQHGLSIHPDPSLVKDCIQELFIKIWRTKENLSQPVSVRNYLYESLKRTILKELAKKKYKLTADLSDDYYFEVVLSHELQLIDIQISEERLKQLEKALQKLTKRQRDAIHLKFYGKLSYEEIAEIMDLNVRSVYNLISKSLEALYQELNGSETLQTITLLVALSTIHNFSIS